MTPERTPHITLVSSVSSEGQEWTVNTRCQHTAVCLTLHQAGGSELAGLTLGPVHQQPLERLVRADFDGPIGGLAQHGGSDPVKQSHVDHPHFIGCERLTTGSAAACESQQVASTGWVLSSMLISVQLLQCLFQRSAATQSFNSVRVQQYGLQ